MTDIETGGEKPDTEPLKDAVITVGTGRGFVMASYVITAAHCLPRLPPAHRASHLEEPTYQNLLAPLGETPSVWAECLFVDPIADIAVLGQPDDQELYDQAETYDDLVHSVRSLAISEIPRSWESAPWPWLGYPALMMALDRRWFSCQVMRPGNSLWVKAASEPIRPGMSGSPILAPDGTAIGVVTLGDEQPHPHLADGLPGWCLRALSLHPRQQKLEPWHVTR
jgi:hypothetical protein